MCKFGLFKNVLRKYQLSICIYMRTENCIGT